MDLQPNYDSRHFHFVVFAVLFLLQMIWHNLSQIAGVHFLFGS